MIFSWRSTAFLSLIFFLDIPFVVAALIILIPVDDWVLHSLIIFTLNILKLSYFCISDLVDFSIFDLFIIFIGALNFSLFNDGSGNLCFLLSVESSNIVASSLPDLRYESYLNRILLRNINLIHFAIF